MAYQLTEEQRMIQAMVREFAREVVFPTAAERDKTKEFPGENLKQMAELGLMGMNAPPEYNGAGADTVSYSVALQEIAYACASTAVIMSVHNSVACGPIYLFGSEYLKETYLKPLASGEKIGSFALTEPGAGSDPSSQKARAVRKGESYVINGTKHWITGGGVSVTNLVFARFIEDDRDIGIGGILVDKGTPGFTFGRVERAMGLRGIPETELSSRIARFRKKMWWSEATATKALKS